MKALILEELHRHIVVLKDHAKLYDNNGLNRGASIQNTCNSLIKNTSISNSSDSCLSSLEVCNIHCVTLHNVEVRNGESPFIIGVDNDLNFKLSFFSLTLLG